MKVEGFNKEEVYFSDSESEEEDLLFEVVGGVLRQVPLPDLWTKKNGKIVPSLPRGETWSRFINQPADGVRNATSFQIPSNRKG